MAWGPNRGRWTLKSPSRDPSRCKKLCHTLPKRLPSPFYLVSISHDSVFARQRSPLEFRSDKLLDIIPDPSLGSGSPALRISDLFSTEEFDRLNNEAASQVQPSRNVKQAVDLVLQDLKPSQRTQ